MVRGQDAQWSTDRRALIAVATQFFVNGALFASFLPRLPEVRDQVGITVAQVGMLMSIAGAGGIVGSIVVGRAIARFGTRHVILVAGVIVSLSLPLIGLARTPLLLIVGLVGMLGFDVPVDVAMNMQGSWLSARRAAPVMNRLHALWSLGTVVGGFLSSRIAAAGVSLTVHLSLAGGLLLLVMLAVSRGLLRTDEPPREVLAEEPRNRSGLLPPGRVHVALFVLVGYFAVSVESTSIEWAAFRLADDYGAAAGFAALGYVAVTVGMTMGRLVGDWATARVGADRLVGLAAALAGVGLGAATLVDNRCLNLGGFVFAGLGIAPMLPLMYDRAARHPGSTGSGLGALAAGLRIASLTIPFLVGTLAASRLSVGLAIAMITLPGIVGFVLVNRMMGTDQAGGAN